MQLSYYIRLNSDIKVLLKYSLKRINTDCDGFIIVAFYKTLVFFSFVNLLPQYHERSKLENKF